MPTNSSFKDRGPGRTNGQPNFRSISTHMRQAMDEHRPILVNTALQLPDQAQAEDHLRSLVTHAYVSTYGEIAGEEASLLDFAKADLDELERQWAEANKRLLETSHWLPASPANQNRTDEDFGATPFKHWSLRHRLEASLLALGLPTMLAASVVTTHAALTSSGLPVFIDNPLLPWAMAGLPGFGGLALKSMGSNFSTEKGHKRFALGIYGAATTCLVTWGACFADQFHGVGGGSLNIFDEAPVWKEKLLVGAQLGSEVLLGTAFFVRLERIAARYDPDHWLENPEHISQLELTAELSSSRASKRGEFAKRTGKSTSHQAALDLQIELALISYRARRARGSDPTL